MWTSPSLLLLRSGSGKTGNSVRCDVSRNLVRCRSTWRPSPSSSSSSSSSSIAAAASTSVAKISKGKTAVLAGAPASATWNILTRELKFFHHRSFSTRSAVGSVTFLMNNLQQCFDAKQSQQQQQLQLQQRQHLQLHQQRRAFSSNNRSGGGRNSSSRRFQLDGLPFSVSPEEALQAFRRWAEEEQGLKYIMSYDSVRIGAAMVPVWSFDVNIRFKQQSKGGSSTSSSDAPKNWKPPMFSAYDSGGGSSSNSSTIFVPGLASYAGYSYRRTLLNPVHSTSLVFLGDKTQPFGGWMLKDMHLAASGNKIEVVPDAWNATRGRTFSIVKDELQDIVDDSWTYEFGDDYGKPPNVQTQIVSSRRVMMPTYVIDYSILGLSYRAFVSGCDKSAPVSGVSHQVFGSHNLFQSPAFHENSRNFLTRVAEGTQQLLRRFNLPMLLWIVRPFATALWFVFVRLFTIFPVVGALGGAFAGFRKVVQPWMDTRRASADWEREREHESQMSEDKDRDYTKDDFDDVSGNAQTFFYGNKTQILRSLSGEYDHTEGDYDWYSDWTAWAQSQWRQQQQQQQQQQSYQQSYQQAYQQQQRQWQQQQQQQQQRTHQQAKPKQDEYHWDFNPNDPYSVLGVPRGSTSKEVGDAFRKNMLKYHPDAQPNASEATKRRLTERSKLITSAYQQIKKELKNNNKR